MLALQVPRWQGSQAGDPCYCSGLLKQAFDLSRIRVSTFAFVSTSVLVSNFESFYLLALQGDFRGDVNLDVIGALQGFSDRNSLGFRRGTGPL